MQQQHQQSHTYHEVIRWVIAGFQRKASGCKKVWRLIDSSLIHDASLVEQHDSIKALKDIRRGLMNGKEDTGACSSHLLKDCSELQGTKAVETGTVEKKVGSW